MAALHDGPNVALFYYAEDENFDMDEEWWYDLFEILPAESIASNAPIMCEVCEDNAVPAFAVYRGVTPQDAWYYCMDCQDADFEGWPDKVSEFPSGIVPSVEHENLMRDICCHPGSNPSRIDPELRRLLPGG